MKAILHQRLITDFFKQANSIVNSPVVVVKKEHDFKKRLYQHRRNYHQSRAFLNKHRHRYDSAITHRGYFFCASANFTEYHVYTTADQVIFVNDLKKHVPSNTLVAHAKVDSDSALEHISVDEAFRRQGIGTALIRFIYKCDKQFYVYSGTEHNSRYRLTCEGAALIRACQQKGILSEEQVILGVPESPASFSPYRSSYG